MLAQGPDRQLKTSVLQLHEGVHGGPFLTGADLQAVHLQRENDL